MKSRRTLPRQTPPFLSVDPQRQHRQKECHIDHGEDEPGVLKLDPIAKGDTAVKVRSYSSKLEGGIVCYTWNGSIDLRVERDDC